jgi:hypothetical protein
MKRRVESAIKQVTEVLRGWECVHAITLGEPLGEDFFDPYFFVSIDVYVSGSLPALEKRFEAFSFVGAFESSEVNQKDRFILDEIPVRVEYRDVLKVRELIQGKGTFLSTLKDSGTYYLYRIDNCEILHQRGTIIDDFRVTLRDLPESFWHHIRLIFQARMEHYLGDLGAAVIRQEPLFFLLSSAGFIRNVCSALFALNRKFEPSARVLAAETLKLPLLPEPLRGRLDTFLRSDSEISPDRKREIAELMAKSILSLG